MVKAWRSKTPNVLNTRPIYTHEFSKLAKAMFDDGITFFISGVGNGYEWFVADYKVPAKSIREVWGLTPHQMRRFVDWLLQDNYKELMKWE